MQRNLVSGLWLVLVSASAAAILLLSAAAASSPRASELGAFQATFAEAWAHYRQVSFYAGRAGNVDVAALELEDFITKWSALEAKYRGNPPDAFSDDAAWMETLEDVGSRARDGLDRLDAGDLDGARALLMPIRGIMGDLRRRNGIATYSDRIDELTAEMTVLARYRREVKELDDSAAVAMVTRQAAVVAYLFERCAEEAPAAVAQDPEFKRQIEGGRESFAKLWKALETGDARLYRISIGELRSYERILFFRFG